MKRTILFFILLIIIAAGIYAYKEYHRGNKDLTGVTAITRINASDLIKAFETDEANANNKYLGKIIAVKGNVKSIEKEANSATIVFGDVLSLSSVRCSMDTTHLEKITSIKVGQNLTVKGNCTGFNKNDIIELGSDVILNRSVPDFEH
jgi:predicted phosphodiesterase